MSAEETLEEKKAQILVKLRGYRLIKREEMQKNGISLTVRMPREKMNALIWVIPTQKTVGVKYVTDLKKAMKKVVDDVEIKRGIIVTSGRYTSAAKKRARKMGIELIPRSLSSFNIFEHEFVPKHELLTPEEREQVLTKYRVQPYQLPRIRASDPAAIVIGAKPGDIVRIVRESPLSPAGKYVSYRYVVES